MTIRVEDRTRMLEVTDNSGASVELSEVRKVFASKRGNVEAVHEISLEVRPGRVVGLLGPSGCGKSTLLRMIAGLLQPSSGRVAISGQPVTKTLTDVGVVFQTPSLLDWMSVIDNVRLQGACRQGNKEDLGRHAAELLRMVGLEDFHERKPFELSGGMQQRVAVCRAMVHRPPLLLMDEPFGALDALSRDQIAVDIQPLLQEARATVLLVTHSISEAIFLADEVLIFSPRPAVIVETVHVPFARPRRLELKGDPRFAALVAKITTIFEDLGVLR